MHLNRSCCFHILDLAYIFLYNTSYLLVLDEEIFNFIRGIFTITPSFSRNSSALPQSKNPSVFSYKCTLFVLEEGDFLGGFDFFNLKFDVLRVFS